MTDTEKLTLTEKYELLMESIEETRRITKENSKNIGGINRSLGKMAEAFIFNSLEKDMTFAGIEFHDIEPKKTKFRKEINLRAEFDIVLTNTDTIAIIEVKQNVEKEHIEELIAKKLTDFRTLFNEYNKYKIVLGMGGITFDDDAIAEANKNGVGLIKVSADKVEFHTDVIKVY